MLAERITAIAPDMAPVMRRWFLESAYAMPSYEEQDWDLVLARWENIPLLAEYAEDPANPLEKRAEAFRALMVLHGLRAADGSTAERRTALIIRIQQTIYTHPEFAREMAQEWLRWADSLILRKMLGEDITDDVPQWILDEVTRRTGRAHI